MYPFFKTHSLPTTFPSSSFQAKAAKVSNPDTPTLNFFSIVFSIVRGVIEAVGVAIPFAGGLFSAVTGAWSEQEQKKVSKKRCQISKKGVKKGVKSRYSDT